MKAKQIPIVGVRGVGKSTLISVFGWWVSYDMEGRGMLGKVTEGINYLSEVQEAIMTDQNVPATEEGMSYNIEIQIFRNIKQKIPPRLWNLFDISGEDYKESSSTLVEAIKNASIVMILFDLHNENYKLEEQLACFSQLNNVLMNKHKKTLRKIPFLFVFSKFDIDEQPIVNFYPRFKKAMALPLSQIKNYEVLRCSSIINTEDIYQVPYGYDQIFNKLLSV